MRSGKRLRFTVLCFALMLGQAMPVAAQEKSSKKKSGKTVYTATVVDTSGFRSAATAFITIRVEQFTTAEEIERLAKASGSEEMFEEMRKMKKGTVQLTGSVGYRVHFASSLMTEDGEKVLIVFERPVSWIEARASSRSLDYPFGVIEMNINQKGKGEGTLFAAAKVKFGKESRIGVEGFEFNPAKLLNVRRGK